MTIVVTEDKLKDYSETDLFRLAQALYQVEHIHENPIDGFASFLKCSRSVVVKWMNGETFPGSDRWFIIEAVLGVKLHREWLKIRGNP